MFMLEHVGLVQRAVYWPGWWHRGHSFPFLPLALLNASSCWLRALSSCSLALLIWVCVMVRLSEITLLFLTSPRMRLIIAPAMASANTFEHEATGLLVLRTNPELLGIITCKLVFVEVGKSSLGCRAGRFLYVLYPFLENSSFCNGQLVWRLYYDLQSFCSIYFSE